MPDTQETNIVIYNILDCKAAAALFDKDGKIGLNPKLFLQGGDL